MMSPMGEVFPPSPFTATKSYLGVKAKGYATIQYANPDHILRNPLIVAEGYDPGSILHPEEKFGESSFQDFLKSINLSGSTNLKNLIGGPPSQYDIIYVDWKNGTDYLQRNAYLLETIIQWVNANKQPLNGVLQPNVVLGQSMGGVIARYALIDMENTSLNHNTRLYISDDAPHQGANVPEGYQHLARHARGLYIRAGVSTILVEIVQLIRGRMSPLAALSLADQPASQQMLINWVNGYNTIDNSAHAAWQTELKNMGYPNGFTGTPFRKVAISNGSECGQPQIFNAGDNLLTYNGKANTRILGDLYGISLLPAAGILLGQPLLLLGVIPGRNDFNFDFYINAQADGYSNQIYHGKITYTKKILWLVPVTTTLTNRNYSSNASTFPYDYFPGGYYNVKNYLDLKNSAYQNTLIKYNITASNQPLFNFVPTVSALDIGSNNVILTKADYLTGYTGATPPAAPKNTPFQNFITAYFDGKVNEQHISIERRNGDWIAAELNGVPQSANCSALCGNITLSGSPALCTPSTYTVSGFSGTAIYTWSSLPLGIVQITLIGNGSQASVSKISNGNVTIFVTISSSCGGSLQKSLPIIVGTQTPSIVIHGIAPYPNTQMDVEVITIEPTPYNWYVDNTLVKTAYQNLVTINGGGCGFHTLKVVVSNTCGTASATTTYNRTCSAITASPNPASNTVSIAIDQNNTLFSENKKETLIYNIKVIDQTGNLKKQYSYPSGVRNTTINLSGYISGMYTIQAFDGTNWNSVKVIKE
ncbi:MAG: T9SS type A sorting domain-containing protein [Ginsengibacter sp.]